MNLFDATLDLASFAQGTADYTITAVSGSTIQCDNLSGRVSEYGNGTIWFRSGNSAGQFGRIKFGQADIIELQDTYPDGYSVGDKITIASWQDFGTQQLINAINSVLYSYKIMAYNNDLQYERGQRIYDLPSDVTTDIRKVVIIPDPEYIGATVKTCHYWKLRLEGELDLYDHRMYPDGSMIGIYYVKPHGPVSKDEPEISSQVDPLYLRYMAWLYLCRNLIQGTHKDNLVSTDMYNEAKIYERDYSHLPNKALMMRDFTFPQW